MVAFTNHRTKFTFAADAGAGAFVGAGVQYSRDSSSTGYPIWRRGDTYERPDLLSKENQTVIISYYAVKKRRILPGSKLQAMAEAQDLPDMSDDDFGAGAAGVNPDDDEDFIMTDSESDVPSVSSHAGSEPYQADQSAKASIYNPST